ncbi:MAG TPA: VOC family protein [Chloroflexota bacterium]|jgi:catechol 2,3-dioxygenase-like lactoylglutathione lyase family enzyme|nr:VOC family protein [Chloroflexota bacterium]
MAVQRAFHTGFTVANMERSLAFYRDLLGLEVTAQWVGTAEYLGRVVGFPGARIKLAFLRAPGDAHRLELLEYESHPGEPTPRETNRPGNGHICFYVDDVWATYRELSRAGVPFVSEPVPITAGVNEGAQAVYARDPDGFTVELFQPRPGAA